jgi:hypothetical protein
MLIMKIGIEISLFPEMRLRKRRWVTHPDLFNRRRLAGVVARAVRRVGAGSHVAESVQEASLR